MDVQPLPTGPDTTFRGPFAGSSDSQQRQRVVVGAWLKNDLFLEIQR